MLPYRAFGCLLLGGFALPSPLTEHNTGRIAGTVRDQAGSPVAGAQIVVVGTTHRAAAGADGTYLIEHLHPGTYTLQARMIGFEPATVPNQRVEAGRTTTVDFSLRTSAVSLEAVVVTGAADAVHTRVLGAVAAYAAQAPGGPEPWRERRQPWNTEEYATIDENPFVAVSEHPLSTFSIDVDRASYSNTRRFINQGQQPPKDAVRIEELVNYFTYDYAEPAGDAPVRVHAEVGAAPWKPQHHVVRIGLQARRVALEGLPPGNFVFLIDVSGSMEPPNKLPLLQSALRLLVNELRRQDRVAVVVYAGAAGLVLPSTPGDRKAEILAAIEELRAGGSTAGGAGIRLAYDQAVANFIRGGNNRVILATDGDFNVGVSSTSELVRLVEEKRETGVFLTVLGFGEGNLKDSRMEQLADKGNGNYAYIDNILEARKVLVHELGGTLFTVAKDVKIQVEFNPARVRAFRLIGYENRLLRDEEFNDDKKDAGEMGAGHSVTALYEVIPVGVETDVVVRRPDSLRYQAPRASRDAASGDEMLFVKIRYKAPDGDRSRLLSHAVPAAVAAEPSTDFRFQAAVAEFGLLLRESEHRGGADIDRVIAAAREALGADREGYRAEFVRLAEAARAIGVGRATASR